MPALDPIQGVLGKRKAKHLLRRACFGYTKEQLEQFENYTVAQALAVLSAPSVQKLAEPHDPQETDPEAQYWTSSTKKPGEFSGHGRKRAAISGWWWYNLYQELSLEHKLTFFLHTSFTVSKDNGTGASTYFYDHLLLLQKYAFGSVKELAKKITMDQAMLYYLDNSQNNANNPNENYAREFMELFTILKGPQVGDGDYTNYTEHDVQMAAEVLSGWKNRADRTYIDTDTGLPSGYPKPNVHVKTDKTFSHAFGNAVIKGTSDEAGMYQEHSDFVDMVFNQDATAISYVQKLYRFFVKSEWEASVDTEVIQPLAAELKQNGYQLLPIVDKLLSSKHFYDDADSDATDNIIGSIVKSPLQLFTEICSLLKVPIVDATKSENLKEYYLYFFKNFVHNSCFAASGFNFYSPDSVAGYPAIYQAPDFDRQWFTSTSIVARYKIIQSLLEGKNLIAGWGKFTAVLDSVACIEALISDPYDVDKVILELSELLYTEAIDADRKKHFFEVLLGEYDKTYWNGAWGDYKVSGDDNVVRVRLDELLIAMVNAAEFQLM